MCSSAARERAAGGGQALVPPMPKRSGRKGFAAGPAHPSYRDGSRAQGGPSEPGAPPAQQLAGRALQQIGELIAEGCLTETEGLAEVSAALCKGEAAAGGASPAAAGGG